MSDVAPSGLTVQEELREVLAVFMAELRERWPLLGSVALHETTNHSNRPADSGQATVAVIYEDTNGSVIRIADITAPGPALCSLIGGEIELAEALGNGGTIEATIGGWSFAGFLFDGPWRA